MRLSSPDMGVDRQYLKVGENEVPDNDAIEADWRNRKNKLYRDDPEHTYNMTGDYYVNEDVAKAVKQRILQRKKWVLKNRTV
jgi:hypothetical protein